MAAPTPIVWDQWNVDYLDLLLNLKPESAEYQILSDLIATINQLFTIINALEARVAALEP